MKKKRWQRIGRAPPAPAAAGAGARSNFCPFALTAELNFCPQSQLKFALTDSVQLLAQSAMQILHCPPCLLSACPLSAFDQQALSPSSFHDCHPIPPRERAFFQKISNFQICLVNPFKSLTVKHKSTPWWKHSYEMQLAEQFWYDGAYQRPWDVLVIGGAINLRLQALLCCLIFWDYNLDLLSVAIGSHIAGRGRSRFSLMVPYGVI